VIVIGDKKYFTFSHSTLTGMDGFWTSDAVKYKTVGKFEPKVLVWCAIPDTGVSTNVKGQTVDADVYIIEC
jgi:hypothetical protein